MNARSKGAAIARLKRQQRKDPKRIISLLLVISMLCGNFMLLPSSAAEMVAYCGKEEHTHSDACYLIEETPAATEAAGETETTAAAETTAAETEAPATTEAAAAEAEETTNASADSRVQLLSDMDSAETLGAASEEETQAAETEAAVEGSKTAETLAAASNVTVSETPVCGKEVHVHTLQCYSNPNADVETAAIWEATLPEKLSGDWGKDLAEVAKSQLGYAESAANYLVGADGETLMGYSRYGAWYSSYTQDEKQAYADWNVPFLFFCLYYAGVEDFPIEEDCADWTAALAAAQLWREAAGEYIPEAGDLVFLDTDEDGAADRAAVVTDWDEAKVTAVESDSEGAVKTVTYDLTEDTQVLGYGDTNEAQAQIKVSGGEDAETLAATANSNYIYLDTSSMPHGDWSTAYIGGVSWNGGWSEASKYDSATGYLYWDVSSWNNTNTNFWIGNSNNWDTIKSDNYRRTSEILMNISAAKGKVFRWDGSTTATISNKTVYVLSEGTFSGGSDDDDDVIVVDSVVDINSEAFSPADDTYYVNASFYDYYTDYELKGNNRDTNTGTFAFNYDTTVTFRKFNTALSNYYNESNNNVKIPLYVGHFQPNWDGWGYQFEGAGLSLYGFKDGKAYGTTSTDQKYFMSVNNSNLNLTPTAGHVNSAAQGLVNSALVNDSLVSVNKSGGTVAMPLFNAAFINGSNSLSKKIGDVYESVSFPFTKDGDPDGDGVEYWEFDSADTTLVMKKDSNSDAYFLDSVDKAEKYKNLNSESAKQSEYGFFPFNSGSSEGNANTYNYGFGCRLDIPFRLTSDGCVLDKNGNKVPIKFEFSGDDDVWVFIDGQLALDIGGSHGKVTGSLNFAEKKATVSATKTNPGSNIEGTDVQNDFTISGTNTDEHVLTMFYMERGMWESNMKVTFNFPDENQLEVEKQLNIDNVNEMFKTDDNGNYNGVSYVGDNCFDDLKFTFNIQNLATHYGTVAAAGADPIAVDGSATGYNSSTFTKGTHYGYSNVFKWDVGDKDENSEWRHRRYGVITLPNTVDISKMSKLSFYIYVDSNDGYDLDRMYLQLVDSSISSAASLVDSSQSCGATTSGFTGDSDAAGCIDSGSYLRGKTYTSPGTDGKQWVKITLDLNKFDKGTDYEATKVKYIRFGYDNELDIYLRGFTFEPTAASSSNVGFVTEQRAIADYGSAESGSLQNATGALYTSTNSTSTQMVDSSGNFVLVDDEVVKFTDQFRRGSYIHLEEVLTPNQDALFNTMWTMYEDGNAVTSLAEDTSVVTLGGSTTSMANRNGNYVDDGRTEKYTNDANNNYSGTRPDESFVFRSYSNPANTKAATKLRAVFTNSVNSATLYINKADAGAGTSNPIDSSQEFTYYIRFYNVGGSGLESKTIVYGPFTLKVGDQHAITQIPVGTKFSIYEIKDDADYSLDSVTGAVSSYTSTVYGSNEAYRVDGTISSESSSVTFKNIKKPVVSLSVTKAWVDGDGNAITTNLPESITIQLQRRAGSNGTWESVSNVGDRTMKPGYAGWGSYVYTFEDLDKYVDYTASTPVAWQYRVMEKNGNGNVIADGGTFTVGTGDNAVEYTVTYDESKEGTDGNWSQTITNTQDSKISLVLTKKWENADNTAFDPSNLPDSIKVQLQRRLKGTTTWDTQTYGIITISKPTDNSTSWTYTFENLEKSGTNSSGSKVDYEYRVVEYGATSAIPNDDRLGNFVVTYAVDSNGSVAPATAVSATDANLEQTITNKYSPIKISVEKKWENTNSDSRSGITVKLQRKEQGSSVDFKDMNGRTAVLNKDNDWKYEFTGLPLVTNNGTLYEYNVVEVGETNNYMVHDNILFKVSYSNFTTDTNSNKSMTITNTAQTVAIDILKKATDTNNPLSDVTFLLEKQGTDGSYSTVESKTTDIDGKVTFSGLCIGVYKLTETKTHDGYNLLASPITIEVTANEHNSAYVIKVNGEVQNIDPVDNVYTYSTTIYNKPKLDMPATGGVGGFEFWILGGLCFIAVPLLLYTFTWYKKGGKYRRD